MNTVDIGPRDNEDEDDAESQARDPDVYLEQLWLDHLLEQEAPLSSVNT